MTSRSSRSRTKRLYRCVFTRIRRQLNAAMSAPIASTRPSERLRHAFQSARSLCDDVETDRAATMLGMRRKPGGRCAPHAPDFFRSDHLERVAESGAGFALHLAEHQRPAPADDEVELEAGDPDVLAEDAVAAKAVVPTRSLLCVGARTPRVPGGPLTVRDRKSV